MAEMVTGGGRTQQRPMLTVAELLDGFYIAPTQPDPDEFYPLKPR